MVNKQRYVWAALFLLFLLMGSSVHSSAAEPVLADGIYIIQMAGTDMTLAAASDDVKSSLMLWPYRPTATWEFRHLGDNVYTVRSNNAVMDGQGRRLGSAIILSTPHKGASQHWKLKREGKFYKFLNVQTGQAMELDNGKREKGSLLQSNNPLESFDQLFCIQRPNAPKFCGDASAKGNDKNY